tara:strand:- start:348 stop:641 length:294 start_codon:yes stop_codon:yes gene_type:complete
MKKSLTERMYDMVEVANDYISGCSLDLQLVKTDLFMYHTAVIKMTEDIKKHTNQSIINELENIEKSRECFERAAKNYMSTDSHTSKYIANRIKELKQ